MQARVRWLDQVCFIGESETGHSVLMDGSPDTGGRNLGARPMELLLLGLGGCSSFDVVTILKKMRQDIRDCVVEISADRAEQIPKVFTGIHLHFVITGKNLLTDQVEKAISLSAEKYCSAAAMLEKTAKLTHDYELIECR